MLVMVVVVLLHIVPLRRWTMRMTFRTKCRFEALRNKRYGKTTSPRAFLDCETTLDSLTLPQTKARSKAGVVASAEGSPFLHKDLWSRLWGLML
jgi:hypothetical protein